jgi:RNA polymerase sigma-70 factor (ECF subfamily)
MPRAHRAPATDVPEFEQRSERHRTALQRYLRVLGCAPDRVDDLVQECFVVLLRDSFEHRSDGETRTFLRRTACNLLRQQARSTQRRREVELADEVWREQCGDGDGDGYVAELRACVAELAARPRRLLEAAYADELGRERIGRELGMRPQGVKTALRRLRAVLRACIERKRRKA